MFLLHMSKKSSNFATELEYIGIWEKGEEIIDIKPLD